MAIVLTWLDRHKQRWVHHVDVLDLWWLELTQQWNHILDPSHLLANRKTEMVKLVNGLVLDDSAAKLGSKPLHIGLISQCVLQSNKEGNWHILWDMAEMELWHFFRSVSRNVLGITAVIVLFPNTWFDYLAVMDQLFQGATAGVSTVSSIPSCWVWIWWHQFTPLVGTAAN